MLGSRSISQKTRIFYNAVFANIHPWWIWTAWSFARWSPCLRWVVSVPFTLGSRIRLTASQLHCIMSLLINGNVLTLTTWYLLCVTNGKEKPKEKHLFFNARLLFTLSRNVTSWINYLKKVECISVSSMIEALLQAKEATSTCRLGSFRALLLVIDFRTYGQTCQTIQLNSKYEINIDLRQCSMFPTEKLRATELKLFQVPK